MTNDAATSRSSARTTGLAIACVVLLVSVVPPLERLRVPGWISDDTALVVAVRTWRPWDGELFLIENTYLLHIPFLWLADVLLPAHPWSLLVMATALHAAGLWLVISFGRHAVAEVQARPVGEIGWVANAVVVASVIGYELAIPITRAANAGVTTRNLEAGLYLLILRYGVELAKGERTFEGRRAWVVASVAVVALGVNDPLVIYTLVLPFAVVALVIGRARALGVAALIGVAGWQLVRLVLPFANVEVEASRTTVAEVGDVPGNLRVTAGGLLDIAGRELWRDDAVPIRLIGVALAAVAIASVIWVLVLVRERFGRADAPWLTAGALVWLLIVSLSYAASSSGSSLANFRYVVAAFPAVAVAVAVAVTTLDDRRLRVGFVAALGLAVVVTAPLSMVRDDGQEEALMPAAADVVERLADDGYDRGYSGFWSASVLTYLSDYRAPVLATLCSTDARGVPHEFVADRGQFERAVEQPGDRSFVVVDRREPLRLACPIEQILEQHGTPTDVIVVDETLEFWLYEGDVVADLMTIPPRSPTVVEP